MAEWTEERARAHEVDRKRMRGLMPESSHRDVKEGRELLLSAWCDFPDLLAAWRAEKARAVERGTQLMRVADELCGPGSGPPEEVANLCIYQAQKLESRADAAEAKLRAALADLSDAAQRAAEMREELIEITRQRDE